MGMEYLVETLEPTWSAQVLIELGVAIAKEGGARNRYNLIRSKMDLCSFMIEGFSGED